MSPYHPRPVPQAASTRTETELLGAVTRIVYRSDNGEFAVARFLVAGEKEPVAVSGKLLGIQPGESLKLHGGWRLHRQHGPTFEVASYLPAAPVAADAIRTFLGSGLIPGIGEARAASIVQAFGEKTLEVIEKTPELLTQVPGVGRKRAEAITAAWEQHRSIREVMLFLHQQGLSTSLASRLIKHYGGQAVAILRTNPHRVGMEVRGIGFLSADRIAQKLGIEKDSPQRITAGILHVLASAEDQGHTYLPEGELLTRAGELLGLDHEVVRSHYQVIAAGSRELRTAVLRSGETAVFMTSLYNSEHGVARAVLRLLDQARPLLREGVDQRLEAFQETYRFQLAERQRDALRSACAGGVVVLTGGPGTGKTTIIRALMYLVRQAGVRVQLCSPTGRAAQRLAETTGMPAATIHRMLKFNNQTMQFTHGPDKPIEADLLVVDESSMLDIPLAFFLLRAIPAGATVVFVGDIDQLPSVGPGNFLRDLIQSGRVRTTRLEVVFRQAQKSLIVQNAHRINTGEAPILPASLDSQPPPDFFLIPRDTPEAIRETLLTVIRDRIPGRFGLDPLTDIQVLTPMRRGDLGTHEINALLQGALNPRGTPVTVGGAPFRVGDKVIQLSNNYELDVFNGDLGRVSSFDPETRTVRVLFGSRPVEFLADELDQLALAYSVTVHKSQGSEYPAVVLILHTSHFVMLRRNLLYTAVTRGKKLVVIIGSRRALHMAIRQDDVAHRLSALAEWLLAPPEAGDLA